MSSSLVSCALLAIAWLSIARGSPARADGAMVYRGRELFREGPAERGYCDPHGSGTQVECDGALTKVLSGYSYGRGRAAGGLAIDPSSGEASGLGVAGASVASAALPGGDIALASIDAVWSGASATRLRATLLDANGLFLCRDTQSGSLVAPMLGMLSRACAPSAVLAVDLGLFAMQWDTATDRWIAEWARLGPSFELLGNGFAHAHLLRSIRVGIPFDVRSMREVGRPPGAETSIGGGLRITTLWRTPHWEARLDARHRVALSGGAGVGRDHAVEGELLLLHNFFASDAVVLQAGLAVRASWCRVSQHAFALTAGADQQASSFAGAYVGWSHEPPDI